MFAQLSFAEFIDTIPSPFNKKKHNSMIFLALRWLEHNINLTIFSAGTQISSDQIQFQSTLKIIITTCGNK